MSISNENRREFPLSQLPRTTSKYVIAYQGANVRQYWTNTRSWSRSPELAKSFYNPGDAYNRYCQLMQQTTLVPSFLGGLRKPSHFGIANLNDDGYWEPMVPLQEPTEKVTPQTSKEEPAQPKLPAVAEAISSDKITLAGLQQVVSYLVLALTHRDALSRAVQKADKERLIDWAHCAELLPEDAVDAKQFLRAFRQDRQVRRKNKDLLLYLECLGNAFDYNKFCAGLKENNIDDLTDRMYNFRSTDVQRLIWGEIITDPGKIRVKHNGHQIGTLSPILTTEA